MQDQLLEMLRDAYSMELALMPVLEAQINDAIGEPEAHQKLLEHLEQTRQHARAVKAQIVRIEGTGTEVANTVEGGISNLMTAVQNLSDDKESVQGEMLQNVISGLTVENFEIAHYSALMIMAQQAGDSDLISTCQQIIEQETAMAAWLTDQLPSAAEKYLQSAE